MAHDLITTSATDAGIARPDPRRTRRAVERRSYAILATSSAAGRPHAAGVLYCAVDGGLYFSTGRSSRKGRNLVANPWAGVTIPVRRLPVGPPSAVQFQARADLLDVDDPDLTALVAAGKLKGITSHGELDLPDVCFVRLSPVGRVHTYGLGLSLRKLIANPLTAGGSMPAGSLAGLGGTGG